MSLLYSSEHQAWTSLYNVIPLFILLFGSAKWNTENIQTKTLYPALTGRKYLGLWYWCCFHQTFSILVSREKSCLCEVLLHKKSKKKKTVQTTTWREPRESETSGQECNGNETPGSPKLNVHRGDGLSFDILKQQKKFKHVVQVYPPWKYLWQWPWLKIWQRCCTVTICRVDEGLNLL